MNLKCAKWWGTRNVQQCVLPVEEKYWKLNTTNHTQSSHKYNRHWFYIMHGFGTRNSISRRRKFFDAMFLLDNRYHTQQAKLRTSSFSFSVYSNETNFFLVAPFIFVHSKHVPILTKHTNSKQNPTPAKKKHGDSKLLLLFLSVTNLFIWWTIRFQCANHSLVFGCVIKENRKTF